MIQLTLDFGTTPVHSKSFSISDAGALTTSNISMHATPSTANSALGDDEFEMDAFTCTAYCTVNGTITAYINATPGPVRDRRNFIYTIG